MESFSNSVLMWIFGKWIFEGEQAQAAIQNTPEITPLVVFASLFSTAGLALIGILGGWAVFLGIFRLRQNGNFFGARDGNEAFFYPIRMVAALALCAPVIVIARADGDAVTLTPAHSMIAGIAKTASEAGDHVQSESFRMMHKFSMFSDPKFVIKVDDEQAKTMVASWFALAAQIESARKYDNPMGFHQNTAPDVFARLLIEARWRLTYPHGDLALPGASDPFAESLVRRFGVPLIAPNGELAKATVDAGNAADRASSSDMATEGLFCKWGAGYFCSDEYKAVRAQNDGAIRAGIAEAQRRVFIGLIAAGGQNASYLFGEGNDVGLDAAGMSQLQKDQQRYLYELTSWYAKTVKSIVQSTIAREHVASSERFHDELKSWGWMTGSAFVLRAAADFSRVQGYADGATTNLMPKSELGDLTGSDTLTKMVHDSALKTIGDNSVQGEKSAFDKFFSADFLKNPEELNISRVTAWGRAMAGTGVGLVSGSYMSGFLGKIPMFKKMGALDNALIKGVGFALILTGGLLGYVLPLIFVVFGIFGVISWITFVMSSFYGVTLWAAAQAAPKGEEHSSQMAAKGWNILVFIGLYPMLAAGGLAAAVVVTNIGLPFVGVMMGGVFGMFDGGTAELGKPLEALAGILIGGLITVIVFAILCWSICVTSAQLITQFPRTVLNMVSFNEPGLNPYDNAAQGVGGSIGGTIQRAVIGQATAKINSGISKIIGGKAGAASRISTGA